MAHSISRRSFIAGAASMGALAAAAGSASVALAGGTGTAEDMKFAAETEQGGVNSAGPRYTKQAPSFFTAPAPLTEADCAATEEADVIVQPLCGVLGTDYSKFFIGTPQLPIPVPNTDVSFAIPEIPIFSKYTRNAYGRFSFNIFNAADRKLLDSFAEINSSAIYNNWIILLVPFSSHNMYMEDSSKAETTVDFFE